MQVYQRSKGKWSVRWREAGKQREQRGFGTRRDAEAWRDEHLRPRVRRGLSGVRQPRFLIDLVREWWDGYVETDSCSQATRETYRTDIRRALELLGSSTDAHTMTRSDISSMARQMQTLKMSNRQVNKTLTALGSCFKYGVQHGLVEENIVRGVSRLPEQRGIIVIPRDEDVQLLLDCAPSERDRLMLMVASLAGLRQSELLGLEWKHVLLRERALIIEQVMDRKGVVRETTKTMHARRVPIPTRLAELLAKYQQGTGLVFTDANGKRLHRATWSRDVWRQWRRNAAWIRAEAGGDWERILELEWKQWRHYSISRWAGIGKATPLQCSRWAGHTSFKLTMDRYGFLFDEDEAAVMDRL